MPEKGFFMPEPVTLSRSASRLQALAATSIGYVIVQLDISVANVALPHIAVQLRASTADLQWVIDAYSLVFASMLLAAGSCADRFGCRRVYAAGLILFCLASAACGMATNAAALIAFRALQGVGGALIFPASLALLNHAYHTEEVARVRAIGWWSTSGAFAVAAGPVIGGLLVLYSGWRSVFLINIPLCSLALWLLLTRTQETPVSRRGTPDVKGLMLAGAALLLLTSGLIEAGRYGWTHPFVLSGLVLAILTGTVFIRVQKKAVAPLLPPGLFRLKGFSGAALVSGTISLTFFGLVFFLSLFFQNGMEYSSWQTGLAFLPLTGAIMGGKILGNHLAFRRGTTWPVTIGLILAGAGNVFLLLVTTGISTPYALLAPGLLLISLGNGLASSVIMASGLSDVPEHLSGTASAVLTTARQTGGVIGVALFGSFLAEGTQYATSARAVFLLSAVLLLAVAAVTTKSRRRKTAM